jgi:5-methylcytosine-specific restriction protein A
MKYPAKHNIAHELLNFADERGFSYGFVQHADSWINLEKLGASVGVYELDDVTVIWCALDQTTRQLRVVGWYDNATAYSEPQSLRRKSSRGTWHFQFKTKTQDAHLIPAAERYLAVPMRTKRTDKGFIGQRNWHFPEHSDHYERFLEAFAEMKLGQSTVETRKTVDRGEFEEGQRLIAEINSVVRNPKLVAAAKARYGYKCQVCDFGFEERYGTLGKGFIEVHHLLPIAARKGQRASTTDDVRVLCANCHRMIHRGPKLLDLLQLKELLK